MARLGDIRIGLSGWTYTPWRGVFYPKGLAQKRELPFAAGRFNALEINGTFYGMQVPKTFAAWRAAVPPGFLFAVKGPRFITHMKRLRDVRTPLANFFASGPLVLGDTLGPILWQLPASIRFDPERLAAFLALLPRTTHEAATLARDHDNRLRAPAHLEPGPDRPLRHCLEIRHDSFRDPAFIALLETYNVALVCADTVDWPLLMDVTADFVYCRLHGSTELYRSRYSPADLDRWAARIRDWATGTEMTDGTFVTLPAADGKPRDVFLFFDNTDKLHAPDNAADLMRRLGMAWGESDGG